MFFVDPRDVEMLSPDEGQPCVFIPDGELEIKGHRIRARVHLFWFLREPSSPVASSTLQTISSLGHRVHLEIPRWATDDTMSNVLSLLYPHAPDARGPSSVHDWTRVCLLASHWGLTSVRAQAERSLEQLLALPTEKAVIGRILGLEAWVDTAMEALSTMAIAIGLTVDDIQHIMTGHTENYWRALMQ